MLFSFAPSFQECFISLFFFFFMFCGFLLIDWFDSSSGALQISRGIKRSHESALSLVEPTGKTRVSVGHVSSSEPPLCRPWDRGDLVRRLATFKSMTWFAKPKVRLLSISLLVADFVHMYGWVFLRNVVSRWFNYFNMRNPISKATFVERWGFLFGVFYIPPSLSSVSGTFANVRPSKIKPVIPS